MGESKLPLYAFVDESGNTGHNLFDVNQRGNVRFFTTAMVTKGNFDCRFGSSVQALAQGLGVSSLHASELGVGRLEAVADGLLALLRTSKAGFFDTLCPAGRKSASLSQMYLQGISRFLGTKIFRRRGAQVAVLFDDPLGMSSTKSSRLRDGRTMAGYWILASLGAVIHPQGQPPSRNSPMEIGCRAAKRSRPAAPSPSRATVTFKRRRPCRAVSRIRRSTRLRATRMGNALALPKASILGVLRSFEPNAMPQAAQQACRARWRHSSPRCDASTSAVQFRLPLRCLSEGLHCSSRKISRPANSDLTLARHRPSLAKSGPAGKAWPRAKLARIYHSQNGHVPPPWRCPRKSGWDCSATSSKFQMRARQILGEALEWARITTSFTQPFGNRDSHRQKAFETGAFS